MSTARLISRSLHRMISGCLGFVLIAALLAGAQSSSVYDPTPVDPSLSDTPANLDPATAATLQPDQVAPATPDTYRIGANDLLSVFVYQMPELTRQLRVSPAGTIALPFLSRPLQATGKTGPELATDISDALETAGLARDPNVQVLVRQVASRPIIVSGAVRAPAVIQAARPMTLLEAISRAGGFTNQAGSDLLLTQPDGSRTRTTEINVRDLLSGTAVNPVLQGNDIIRVIPAKLIYTVGAFKQPGAFPIHPGEPLTVMKALALSAGTANSPNLHHSEIIRTTKNGHIEIPLDVARVLKHKAPDVQLEAGDILYIPEDGTRKALGTILSDVGQIAVISVGYGASSKVF